MNLADIERAISGSVPMKFGGASNLTLKVYGWEEQDGAAMAHVVVEQMGKPDLLLPETVIARECERVVMVPNFSAETKPHVAMFFESSLRAIKAKYATDTEINGLKAARLFHPKVLGLKKATSADKMLKALSAKSRMGFSL